MIANNIQHRIGWGAVQGIRAKAAHAMLRKDSIDFGFISHEVRPVSFLQPRHIPGSPKSFVTGVQRPPFLFHPLSEYPVSIEVSTAQVPVAAIPDLNQSHIEIPVQIRGCLSQSDLGSFDPRWVGRHPKTELVLL